MDFTQMPVSQGYKYLLVIIDTFTGWIEGLPTRTERAEEVVKKELLHETIPRFGLPRSLQSDNGTSFTSKVTQGALKHWALLISPLCLEASVFRKNRKSQPILKISDKKDNPGDLSGMEGGFTNSFPPHHIVPKEQVGLRPSEMLWGTFSLGQCPLPRSRVSDPPVLYHGHWSIPKGYTLVGGQLGPKRF